MTFGKYCKADSISLQQLLNPQSLLGFGLRCQIQFPGKSMIWCYQAIPNHLVGRKLWISHFL